MSDPSANRALITLRLDAPFLDALDRARGHLDRSTFIRDAIAAALTRRGVAFDERHIYAPSRAGKGGPKKRTAPAAAPTAASAPAGAPAKISGLSSKLSGVAKELSGAALAEARRLVPESPRSPATGAPSARTPRPKRAAARRTKSKPATPNPVPGAPES